MSKQSLYKKYADVGRINLWGEELSNGKRPRLVFGFRDGNPRIIIYTGEQGPQGVITYGMDYPNFGYFLETLKEIIDSPEGTKESVDSILPAQDGMPEKNIGVLHVGKTKDGIIYLSVIAENKPKLVFTIKGSKFHRYFDSAKSPVAESLVSKRMATSLYNYLYNIVSNVVVSYMVEEYTHGPREAATIVGYGAPEEGKPKQEPKGAILEELSELDL